MLWLTGVISKCLPVVQFSRRSLSLGRVRPVQPREGSLAIRWLYALLGTVALMATAFAASATPPAGATTLPGLITGSVDAGTTGAALPGVCVYAMAITGYPGHWTASGAQYDATTGASGTYELTVPVGTYGVTF